MVNFKVFKEANVLTSIGVLFLFVYVISINSGTPLPSWLISLLMWTGAIGTLIFLIKKIFMEGK